MKALSTRNIETRIGQADTPGCHEAWLYPDGGHRAQTPPRTARDWALDFFLQVFARMVVRFGEPDFPGATACDWRAALGLDSELLAVRNFDYYQLSLRVVTRAENDGGVVLAKHVA